jgi:hypothetical protein
MVRLAGAAAAEAVEPAGPQTGDPEIQEYVTERARMMDDRTERIGSTARDLAAVGRRRAGAGAG